MWVWRYTLTPKRRLSGIARPGLREGAPIRNGDGVADVHPWPELGDAPLDEQLVRLARMPPGGSGFGFDDLLEKLPWKKLA
ncbi:MAG TPA: hypothetical protein VF980_12150 [Thermoanaerobaculia bacterium]